MYFIIFCKISPPKCLKSHSRDSRFQNFPRDGYPRTPLEGLAPSAFASPPQKWRSGYATVHAMWMKIPPLNSVKQFLWMVLVKCQHEHYSNLRSLEVKVEQTVCLHFELLYFLKYDVLSEYLTPFWFAMLLNEYEIESMFRKIRNIRNLGNVYMRGS
jgi:hypothetical protein